MKLVDLLLRRRLATGVLLALVSVVAVVGAGRLSFDDDYRSVFRSDSEEYRFLERLTEEFGHEENELFLLLPVDDALAPDGLRRLFRLHRQLAETPGVAGVYSLASYPGLALPLRRAASDAVLARAASREPVRSTAAGRLVSRDRRLALLVASLGDGPLSLAEIDPALAVVRDVAERHGARVTGMPAVRSAVIRAVQRDQMIFNVTAVGLAGGVALLLFRQPLALLIVGLGPVLGVLWSMGALGWAGESINVLNNLVPQLVLAIGFTDAVHLALHFRRRRSAGLERLAAARATLREIGLACLLTSLTTAVGFASLYLARVELVRRFGLACAAGALLGFVAVSVSVPLLCSTPLGDRLVRSGERRRRQRAERLLELLTRPAFTRPGLVAAAAVVLLAALGGATASLRPNYRYTENLPDDSGAAEVIALREEAFGGSVPVLVRVGWGGDLQAHSPEVVRLTREVESALEAEPLVHGVTSVRQLAAAAGGDPDDPGPALARMPPELLRRWVAPDAGALLVVGVVPDRGSATLLPVLERIRGRLDALSRGEGLPSARLGGLTALAASSSVTMIGDLARSLGLAAVVIFGAMAVAFRSPAAAVVSVLPNLLPLLGVTGILAVLGLDLRYTSVAVLSIGLGIAVDDTIHFLVGFRRHGGWERAPAAARTTVRTVGSALCTTTALLMTGLATLATSTLPTIRLFGLLMCALLALALLADLYALPALLLVARRYLPVSRPAGRAVEEARPGGGG